MTKGVEYGIYNYEQNVKEQRINTCRNKPSVMVSIIHRFLNE
ncbi:MAG: hypothetical protein AB1394_11155 [Bacteroidota bacterium]